MNVIERIEELRNQRGWTKYKLAEEAMLTYSTLSAIYSRATPPKIEILEMICNAFGITLAQFFSQGEEPQAVTADESELLELYRTLSYEKRIAVLTLLKNN